MSAPAQVLISELQCRILVEVYLAHGPVDIFRLWSEMFERQKSISSGMWLFTRAIVQLEDEGYLQKVAEMNSTLAPKGEMYLIGAVLSGELPEGCWEKISSTQNILDVAPQGDISIEGSTTNGRTKHCDTQEVFREGLASNRHDGNEGILGRIDGAGEGRILRLSGEATRNGIDVAGQASGNAPLTDGFQVGDEGVSGTVEGHGRSPMALSGVATTFKTGNASEYQASPADSQFQGTTIDELLALVASKLPDISLSEQSRLEEIEAEREGGDTAASGYPEPMYERNGR